MATTKSKKEAKPASKKVTPKTPAKKTTKKTETTSSVADEFINENVGTTLTEITAWKPRTKKQTSKGKEAASVKNEVENAHVEKCENNELNEVEKCDNVELNSEESTDKKNKEENNDLTPEMLEPEAKEPEVNNETDLTPEVEEPELKEPEPEVESTPESEPPVETPQPRQLMPIQYVTTHMGRSFD